VTPVPNGSSKATGGPGLWRDSALLAAVALGVRLCVVAWAWGRFPPTADATYYHQLATRLAAGQGYTWLWPDGVVTYAAHYPVGYPAALGALYALFGAHPGVGMVGNALLGALGCLAVHRLVAPLRRRAWAFGAGALVAFHPGLVGYTPALMTEGVTAALVAVAAWAAAAARGERRAGWRWARVALLGVVCGLGTLVRPQCLLLAPMLGLLAVAPEPGQGWRLLSRRWARPVYAAVLGSLVALATCAPWTARNCQRMGRCALVSVNGGWNLLIGTNRDAGGGWAPIEVPEPCRTVFDEAAKDVCFEQAAWQSILAHPGSWLEVVPRKLAATFDYCGAAGWYLHQSNAQAFGRGAKTALGVVETAYERLVLLLALALCLPRLGGANRGRGPLAKLRELGKRLGALWLGRTREPGRSVAAVRAAIVVVGIVSALSVHAWVGYLALTMALALDRPLFGRAMLLRSASAAVLLSVAATHAVFFGGGRYALVGFPLMCALAALGAARWWPRRVPTPSAHGGHSATGSGRPHAP
jgi:4-amino-4-deoxy-L-arabinose transferase-like glycosyltransferase